MSAEEDEEVRIAMEMAMAAAKNPHLSPEELRKLVSGKNNDNEQAKQVDQLRTKVEEKKKQEGFFGWFSQPKQETAEEKAAAVEAAKKAQEKKDAEERAKFADQINADPEYRSLVKQARSQKKTIKNHKVESSRNETRHIFKRQRLEKNLVTLTEKLVKTQKLFIGTNYNIHEYAKAMMKASKKWKKKGSDQEINLEAQLCRNMHQMLALEKQKSKLKKSSREIKKYMQRCKSWLTDKQALCEMHLMTLDATQTSMRILYEETLKNQDALIKKLTASDEFKGTDLDSVELKHWKVLSEVNPEGPEATLQALRGLPMKDSIRVKKEKERVIREREAAAAAAKKKLEEEDSDEGSLQSFDMSEKHKLQAQVASGEVSLSALGDSVDNFDFGQDAPWTLDFATHFSGGASVADESVMTKETSATSASEKSSKSKKRVTIVEEPKSPKEHKEPKKKVTIKNGDKVVQPSDEVSVSSKASRRSTRSGKEKKSKKDKTKKAAKAVMMAKKMDKLKEGAAAAAAASASADGLDVQGGEKEEKKKKKKSADAEAATAES